MIPGNKIIFIVEDNVLYAKTVEKHLRENVKDIASVRTFENGEDCLKNMTQQPKIVVLDYNLNGISPNALNGLEILKRIKITNPETVVLMLSSQDNLQVATDTMKYGAYDYVAKNENSFVRLLNLVNNINVLIKQSDDLKTSRQVKRVLIAWIVLLIAVIVILQLFFPNLMNRNL